MPTPTEVAALALEMKRAQVEARQIEPFSARVAGFDLPCAYAVAAHIHRERVREGAHAVGRKIGFTNPAMLAVYGVSEPIWAYVYDTTVVHVSGGQARCSLAKFTEPKIEPEVVLHFQHSPPGGADAAAILACIDWMAHGFEIVQSHFPGWKFRAADTVADSSLHAALLVGEPQPIAKLGADPVSALERFTLSLRCDGALRDAGRGSNVLGSPLLAVAHLVDVLGKQSPDLGLRGGELVTTGTITAAHAASAGERWSTEIDGIALAGLSVEFTC